MARRYMARGLALSRSNREESGALLGFWLYPIWWPPPTPNLYVSSDYRVTVVAVGVAVGVVAIDHFAISDTG
jgi:hypothetical protein